MPPVESKTGLLSRRSVLGGVTGLVTILPLAACSEAINSSSVWADLDRAATNAIENKMTPGLSIAVMKDGALIHSKGFGLANLETQSVVKSNTIFRIASVTKQFTGAMILLLHERGVLSIEDHLSKYFPEFPRAGEISIRQIATHTSGLGNYTRNENRRVEERADYTPETFLELMRSTSPLFAQEPGTQFNYSNTGYGLLGLIIEKVTGQTYDDTLEENIFDPLGLENTAVDSEYDVVPNRASGYYCYEGRQSGFINAPFTSMAYPAASGAIRSTADDLCTWHSALLNHRLLKPETFDIMRSPAPLKNGEVSEYGFGVGLRERQDPFKGQTVLTHGGGIRGFTSHLRTFPYASVTVACLFNSDGGAVDAFGTAFDAVKDQAALIATSS